MIEITKKEKEEKKIYDLEERTYVLQGMSGYL